jgi:nucleotide-binding universal stress UspA family protein
MTTMPAQSVWELPAMFIRQPVSHVPRVIVGVDDSTGSAAALRWAAAEACRRQVMLRIVSVWEDPGRPASYTRCPAQMAAARVQKALAQVLDQQPYPRHVACATIEGTPGRVLLDDAGDAGLLVLGATGVGAAQAPGPVGRHCLQRGRGPLVFVSASRLPDVIAGVLRPPPR